MNNEQKKFITQYKVCWYTNLFQVDEYIAQ